VSFLESGLTVKKKVKPDSRFEKTAKKDQIKVTVEGMKHDGKILVEKLTEAE
jgi:hypothetical protein